MATTVNLGTTDEARYRSYAALPLMAGTPRVARDITTQLWPNSTGGLVIADTPAEAQLGGMTTAAYAQLVSDISAAQFHRAANTETVANCRTELTMQVFRGNGLLPSAGVDTITTSSSDFLDGEASTNLARTDRLLVHLDFPGFEGTDVENWMWVPTTSNNKLVIMHGGHNPTEALWGDGENTLIKLLMDQGYTVIGCRMPFYEGSTGSAEFTVAHDAAPGLLRYWCEPAIRCINQFTSFTSVYIAGHSGGGWSSIILSALDPRISRTFTAAGFLPLYHVDNTRDQEQKLLSTSCSYLDFCIMSCDPTTRRTKQVLVSSDACCFQGVTYNTTPYESMVQTEIGSTNFTVQILAGNQHEWTTTMQGVAFSFFEAA